MELLEQYILQVDGFFWAVVLGIATPLIIVMLNELIARTRKRYSTLSPPVNVIKNIIIPFGAVIIVLVQVLDVQRENTLIKILETVLWIFVINTLIAVVNAIYFSGGGDSESHSRKIPQLFLDISRVALVLVGIAIILSSVWGADLSGLATALGLGSFVLGLALQDTLGNLFSGIALVYEKPFKEGDVIELDDTFGKIIKINWRAIRIETIRGDMVVIPHLMMAQAAVKNYNQPTRPHYMTFEIGFDYHVPPNEVKAVLIPVCLETPSVLHDPPPAVKVIEYKETTVLYEIEFAIHDFWEHEEILDDIMTRCWYAMRRGRLAVPVNQWVDHFPHKGLPKDRQGDADLAAAIIKLPRLLPIKEKDLMYIEKGISLEIYGKDELVIRQSQKAGDMFIVMSGSLSLTHTAENANANEIVQLNKGDVFGEIPAFTGQLCTFSALAISDVEVLKITANEASDLVQMNDRVASFFDDLLNMRLRMLSDWETEEAQDLEELVEEFI